MDQFKWSVHPLGCSKRIREGTSLVDLCFNPRVVCLANFFSALLILYFVPFPPIFNLQNLEFSLRGNHVILVWKVWVLIALVYSVLYVSLDLKVGSFVASQLGLSLAWKVVFVVQLVCWAGQFIGHGVFEATCLMQVLQTLFGYEPYPRFNSTVKAKIEANINEWQESKQKLIS
ncbi:hypothetical protein GYH30_000535 [Glycine max]|uniref:Uncharacterized protein n=1 Tax=Glycine max TaxID=3847 RepID=K7K1W8_SOYBN|nr:hypothetical protein GYH30_000535 [Glycine max]